MNSSRRTLLTGGGALAAMAAMATVGLVSTDRWAAQTAGYAPVGADLFLLHGKTVPVRALENALWREARPTHMTAHKLDGLSSADFGPLRKALVGAGGHRLFAVIDDAQALVVEAVLSRSVLSRRLIDIGAINDRLGRRGLILLTGTIQE